MIYVVIKHTFPLPDKWLTNAITCGGWFSVVGAEAGSSVKSCSSGPDISMLKPNWCQDHCRCESNWELNSKNNGNMPTSWRKKKSKEKKANEWMKRERNKGMEKRNGVGFRKIYVDIK